MTDDSHRPSRLEQSPNPIAIVHEGFFVYANAAFLDRLGYRSLNDLQATPLLDAVEDRDHERLRGHLDAAKRAAGTDQHLPEARLSFRKTDDLPLLADCTSFRTRYAGEDCVQINLRSQQDSSLQERMRNLPWRHYLSLLFLVLFTVLPSTLLLRLNIDNSPTVYFPDDEPAVVLDRELRTRFPNDQVFVLLFEGVALFSDGFLTAYDELGRGLLKLDAIDDVVAVTLQDHIAGTNDEFVVEHLIDVRKLSDHDPSQRKTRMLEDRFSERSTRGDGWLGAGHGRDTRRGRQQHRGTGAGRADSRSRPRGPDSTATSRPSQDRSLLMSHELRSMLRDNMIFIPATVGIGLAMIWWLFRRWLAVMLAGIAIGVVVNSTVAFYVLLNQPFTLVSSIIPPCFRRSPSPHWCTCSMRSIWDRNAVLRVMSASPGRLPRSIARPSTPH